MDNVLINVATAVTEKLSMNSGVTVEAGNVNLTYTRATAASLSTNVTNATGTTSVSVDDLCTLLGQSNCGNTPFISQVR
jgi:hypothetical protein